MALQVRFAQLAAALGHFQAAAHHPDVGLDAHGLDRAAVGRVVERRGQLQPFTVAQRHHLLHRALAEALGTHDHAAALVLQRAGDDFRRGGAAAVDQHHERHVGSDRLAAGGEAHLGVGQAPFGVDHQAALQEGVGHGDGGLQHAARVVAQIEHQALQRAVALHAANGVVDLLAAAALELADPQVAVARFQHFAAYAFGTNDLAGQGDVERRLLPAAQDL